MRSSSFLFLVSSFLLLFHVSAFAENLGVIGDTFQIKERDFLEVIHEKLQKKKESGELARLEEEMKQTIRHRVENPRPILSVTKAEVGRVYYHDPTHVLEQEIIDSKGGVLYPAGTPVNPLDYVALEADLLFFDARDPKHVKMAARYIKKSKRPVIPILVGGSFLKLAEKWKQPIYYDQGGAMTRQLGIKHVPAIVTQEGKLLRIEEVKL